MLQKKGITKIRQEITLSQWWYVSEEKFGVDNDEKAIIYYKFCFQASIQLFLVDFELFLSTLVKQNVL